MGPLGKDTSLSVKRKAGNSVLPRISTRSNTRLRKFAGLSRSPELRCTGLSRPGKTLTTLGQQARVYGEMVMRIMAVLG
jgi:hypothetical protein